ncbi:hypothetical protein PM8797T_28649 [Gimesia maris DSM 8797]|nr:hypothetical protein PM8797T_28649 [Gimesia maris DSM 8797]
MRLIALILFHEHKTASLFPFYLNQETVTDPGSNRTGEYDSSSSLLNQMAIIK